RGSDRTRRHGEEGDLHGPGDDELRTDYAGWNDHAVPRGRGDLQRRDEPILGGVFRRRKAEQPDLWLDRGTRRGVGGEVRIVPEAGQRDQIIALVGTRAVKEGCAGAEREPCSRVAVVGAGAGVPKIRREMCVLLVDRGAHPALIRAAHDEARPAVPPLPRDRCDRTVRDGSQRPSRRERAAVHIGRPKLGCGSGDHENSEKKRRSGELTHPLSVPAREPSVVSVARPNSYIRGRRRTCNGSPTTRTRRSSWPTMRQRSRGSSAPSPRTGCAPRSSTSGRRWRSSATWPTRPRSCPTGCGAASTRTGRRPRRTTRTRWLPSAGTTN